MNSKHLMKVLTVLLMLSCQRGTYQKVYDFPDDVWLASDAKQFNVEITDISRRYDLLIHIRNNVHYKYSNIFLFVHVLYPDNTEKVDTVEGFFANAQGQWLGKGRGKYRDNSFIYKKSILFPQKGLYIFSIEQAMRDDTLRGIASIGFEVLTSQK